MLIFDSLQRYERSRSDTNITFFNIYCKKKCLSCMNIKRPSIMKSSLLTLLAFTLILFFACTQEKKHQFSLVEEDKEGISGAYESLNFLGNQRVYPNEEIPADGYIKAFKTVQNKFRNPSTKSSSDVWKSLGPHNIGGRTLAIAVNPQNPNTIYAGSASGGLWRSYTQGKGATAWHKMDINFPVLGVSSIAISPIDTTIMYIGTGEVYNYKKSGTSGADRATRGSYGMGILKTTDGGLTWEKSLDWAYNSERGIQVVKMNPLNHNTLWAGTTEGTYKSTDAGATWTQVNEVKMVMDLAISSADTNVVLIGCGNFASEGFGLYRTGDGGGAWTKITENLPNYYEGKTMVDFSLSDPSVAYASIGNGFSQSNGASWLYRSNDAGQNWTLVTNEDYSKWQGWFSHDVGVNPTNPDEAMVVGIDIWKLINGTLFKVTDGGVILGTPDIDGPDGPSDFSHSDHHAIIYDPTNPDRIYFANDGGIYVSEDGGLNFESRNGAYQTTQFYNGNANASYDSLLFMGGLQDNSTALYSGGLAWRKMLGGDGSNSAFHPDNKNLYYIGYQRMGLTKSFDQGYDNFNFLDVPGEGLPVAFIAPYKLGNQNPELMYAGRSVIYKSLNGGNSWTALNDGQALDGNPALSMVLSRQTDDIVYIATAPYFEKHGVFVTQTGGLSWTDISSDILPDRYPMDMAIDPKNDNIAYIVYSGFGTDHVFRTTDSGQTWTAIDNGLPDVPTSAILVDEFNSEIIYVGNDIGVFGSIDSGASWEMLQGGIPDNVMVMDLSISLLNKKLRAATHGNGTYERPVLKQEIVAGTDTIYQTDTIYIAGTDTIYIEQIDTIYDTIQVVQVDTVFIIDTLYSGINENRFEIVEVDAFPNPVIAHGKFSYILNETTDVQLTIFDATGKAVLILVNEKQQAGEHLVDWNREGLPSGIYVYKLNTTNSSISGKLILE